MVRERECVKQLCWWEEEEEEDGMKKKSLKESIGLGMEEKLKRFL